jgi:phosphatidylserine/phosphatidylglycerophosphate/cardiolipin synthase-like enzyme
MFRSSKFVATLAVLLCFSFAGQAEPIQHRSREPTGAGHHYIVQPGSSRFDAIDAALIAGAKRTIDFAAYSLTDGAVLDALNAAERRGVAIRIVLDPRERHDFARLGDAATAVIKSIYQNVPHDIDLQAD